MPRVVQEPSPSARKKHAIGKGVNRDAGVSAMKAAKKAKDPSKGRIVCMKELNALTRRVADETMADLYITEAMSRRGADGVKPYTPARADQVAVMEQPKDLRVEKDARLMLRDLVTIFVDDLTMRAQIVAMTAKPRVTKRRDGRRVATRNQLLARYVTAALMLEDM